MRRLTIALMLTAILSGCATTGVKIQNASLENGKREMNMLIEPYESLGLKKTEAIQSGEAMSFYGIFPDMLFGEYYPGRVRWNAWFVSESGTEYFGQMILSGIDFSGAFQETILLDGKPSDPSKARGVILSSLLDYGYDFTGNEFLLDAKKFKDDPAYRKKIVLERGTRISDMRGAPGVFAAVEKWNAYQTPSGVLLSPIGERELKTIAGINPQYSISEKLIGNGNFSVIMDPIGTMMGIGLDVFRASNGSVPSVGWDYNSQVPNRRAVGYIISYPLKMKQGLINKINKLNTEKLKTAGR